MSFLEKIVDTVKSSGLFTKKYEIDYSTRPFFQYTAPAGFVEGSIYDEPETSNQNNLLKYTMNSIYDC